MRSPQIVGALAPLAGLLLVGASMTHAEGQTSSALQIAHDRETRTRVFYEACAERAGMEGYFRVRNLFRALAAAEHTHARMLASRLEQMGATVGQSTERIPLGTTAENLESALVAERFERTVSYEHFKSIARGELEYDALAVFRYACDAEASHARKLAEALNMLDETRWACAGDPGGFVATSDAVQRAPAYFVCSGCGCVRSEASVERCVCGTSGRQFSAVRDTSVSPPAALAVW